MTMNFNVQVQAKRRLLVNQFKHKLQTLKDFENSRAKSKESIHAKKRPLRAIPV